MVVFQQLGYHGDIPNDKANSVISRCVNGEIGSHHPCLAPLDPSRQLKQYRHRKYMHIYIYRNIYSIHYTLHTHIYILYIVLVLVIQ